MDASTLHSKLINLLILFLTVKSVNSNNVTFNQNNKNVKINCVNDFRDINGVKAINTTEYCQNQLCISKCCRTPNRIYYFNGTHAPCRTIDSIMEITNKSISIDYGSINIYKSNLEKDLQKSNVHFENVQFVLNKKMSNGRCATMNDPNDPNNLVQDFYILENGSLVYARPNFYMRFPYRYDFGDFCMEHVVIHNINTNTFKGPFLTYRNLKDDKKSSQTSFNIDVLKATAMLISCFFLLLVLLVYGVLRELRNLVGMIMMAYVATLFTTFLFKVIELRVLGSMPDEQCKPIGVFLYFTILSSFSWMCTMSLDIWWTFRGMFKHRPIHRRGELAKFGLYGLYAWGVPLLITIAVGVIDYTDLRQRPLFFKPHFELCFFTSDAEIDLKFYLYIPVLVLLILDWIFFLLTAFNIWRIKRCMSQFANEASKYNNNQNRFSLYIKLALVMGISWILEIMDLPTWMQAIATAYNCLIGVAIFFIFVFKRKIFLKLCQRFSIQNEFVENMQRKYSNFTSASGDSHGKDRKQSTIELEEPTKTTDI